MPNFLVRRKFISGILEGLEREDILPFPMRMGMYDSSRYSPSGFVITACIPVEG
jgi:hypothetical protein